MEQVKPPHVTDEMIDLGLDAVRKANETSTSDLKKIFGFIHEDRTKLDLPSSLSKPDLGIINMYARYFDIPVSSIIYIAEQIRNVRQGQLVNPPCPYAARVFEIKRAMDNLTQVRIQFQEDWKQ